ncbi:hypothetical protein GGR56DRAFT_619104 [Xylariaceae sp. FL0804]|nr:hypothetical protein GGR56DRAFT_619104 [Xylariaceae sp. FL0804]
MLPWTETGAVLWLVSLSPLPPLSNSPSTIMLSGAFRFPHGFPVATCFACLWHLFRGCHLPSFCRDAPPPTPEPFRCRQRRSCRIE